MKTAMEELKEKLKDNLKWIVLNADYELMDKLFIQGLEKEKEQIQNVFEHCWNHPNWKGEYDIKDMEDYLKNYNQNK
jgi:hypothetical protein